MSTLSNLLNQVKGLDPKLAAELTAEVKGLQDRVPFGLHFERHRPESVRLFGQPVHIGSKVQILPPRGQDPNKGTDTTWTVEDIDDLVDPKHVCLYRTVNGEKQEITHPLEDLVVVAEFKDQIFPGLVQTGEVINGSADAPFHTVINAENYHALKALEHTHAGRVDAIYIDPPYNTGNKDWKYNNDYVGGDDVYTHSKWLAFMERRLLQAKKLLSPAGTLVVTVDEHEVHRLGLLLDQVLPEHTRQMVTIVNNPKGVTQGFLSRVEEYAFFCFGPEAKIGRAFDDLLTHRDDDYESSDDRQRPRWKGLLRSGDDPFREDRPDMFYPVWVNAETRRLYHAGDPLPLDQEPDFDARSTSGLVPIWPVRKDGKLGRWGVGAPLLNTLIEEGLAACGKFDKRRKTWGVTYVSRSPRLDLELGLIEVLGEDEVTGVKDIAYIESTIRRVRSVWHRQSHDAGAHGTDLVGSFVGAGRSFPFPKSLYAVEDSLRPLVIGNPNAVVLDFFAGSGTTAHALMRLNRQDGGHRQCISVTNNEVGIQEHQPMAKEGLRPGDSQWEEYGICDSVTKPRIEAAITGMTPAGMPVKGQYRFTDEFPMSEGFKANARFFTLTYESPSLVNADRAFSRIAPMMWLRAGAIGRVIESLPSRGWDVAEGYAVLAKLDAQKEFVRAVEQARSQGHSVNSVFIITSSQYAYQRVATKFGPEIETVHMYRTYLADFGFTNI